MSYGAKIECWGPYACFTRPEMKTERVSYDVMTPSAARGIAEAIFWHPGLRYVIDEIDVLNPIRFTNIRRNEVKSKVLGSKVLSAVKGSQEPLAIITSRDIQQRAAAVLCDVYYCITLHFEMTECAGERDNPGKFKEMLTRRARKGQCYHQPYLGCREFPARFRLVEEEEEVLPYPDTRDLGFMLFDMDYHDQAHIVPRFFRGRLQNGVLDLRDCEVHQ